MFKHTTLFTASSKTHFHEPHWQEAHNIQEQNFIVQSNKVNTTATLEITKIDIEARCWRHSVHTAGHSISG
jgi:hypothetical protein